jgi:hypothetical protein
VALAGTIATQASSPQRRYGRNFTEGGTGPIRIGTIPKMSDPRRLSYAADTLGTSIASLALGANEVPVLRAMPRLLGTRVEV